MAPRSKRQRQLDSARDSRDASTAFGLRRDVKGVLECSELYLGNQLIRTKSASAQKIVQKQSEKSIEGENKLPDDLQNQLAISRFPSIQRSKKRRRTVSSASKDRSVPESPLIPQDQITEDRTQPLPTTPSPKKGVALQPL